MQHVDKKLNVLDVENPHKRAKQPEKVRRAILKAAEVLAAGNGEESVSFAKIAKMVGVSTGAVIHHFPNKKELLAAVVEMEADDLREEYERSCEEGADRKFLFTRIYVSNILEGKEKFSSLTRLTLASTELGTQWQRRMSEILSEADPSDRSDVAQFLRFCADGIWLTRISTQSDCFTKEAETMLTMKLNDLNFRS